MAASGVVACIEPAFWLGQPRTRVGTYIDYLGTAARSGVRGRKRYFRARFPFEAEATWPGS